MARTLVIGCLSLMLAAAAFGCEREAEQRAPEERQAEQQRPDDREPTEGKRDDPGRPDVERTAGEDQPSNETERSGDPAGDARTITIEPVDNQMKYEQTEITVEAGETVRIVFDNIATDEAMKHNVVVLTTDDSNTAMEVAQAGWKIPDQEYVPDHEAVLAHTPMSDPGETVEVTFTAPDEPGEYLYICTFPGHYPTMTGTMIVEEG